MDKLFNEAIKIGESFQKRKKIINSYSEKDLINKVKRDLPIKEKSLKKVFQEFEREYLPFCVNQASPKYLAFPDSGNYPEAIVADILKIFLNQNLIADVKSAPIGTYMEIQIIDWFRQIVGYKKDNSFPKNVGDIGGVLCFGGVMSIVTSLLVARSRLKKNSFEEGFLEKNTYLLVPDTINHYSAELSLGYLGIGTRNIVKIKLDEDFKMDLEDLKKQIGKIKSKAGKILAVMAYAGDSRTMRVDDLDEISKICKKENIWFHVDACHGGSLLFSEKLAKKLKGIQFADSITLDPHKTLGVPYPCSLALFRKPEDLKMISKNHDITIAKKTYDLGQITPFIGSKSFESLKLWFLLNTRGKKKIGKEVERRFELASFFKKTLDCDKDFEVLNNVNINSVCFIYFPLELKKLFFEAENKKPILNFIDELNKNIHDVIYQSGKVCIHTFKLTDKGNRANLKSYGERQCLGIILGNFLTSKKDLKSSFDIIKNESKKIYNKMKLK